MPIYRLYRDISENFDCHGAVTGQHTEGQLGCGDEYSLRWHTMDTGQLTSLGTRSPNREVNTMKTERVRMHLFITECFNKISETTKRFTATLMSQQRKPRISLRVLERILKTTRCHAWKILLITNLYEVGYVEIKDSIYQEQNV